MGTKNNPNPNDCYAKALPDEPMFVLLARDLTAPELVRDWAEIREVEVEDGIRPAEDRSLVTEARNVADAMEMWRADNDGKWRAQATGALPDAFVSREATASFIERYGERFDQGPAVKERSAPINDKRHTAEERAVIKTTLTALAQMIRTGIDQPEADWPAPMTTDETILGVDRPAEFPLGDGLFRKRPVTIAAFQMTEALFNGVEDWPEWAQEACDEGVIVMHGPDNVACRIHTLEGVHDCTFGDWIIRGVKGELYPCKPDIFAATYDRVR